MTPTPGSDGGDAGIPDTVPPELVRDHGLEARRTVRESVRRRRLRALTGRGDEEVWVVAAAVFVLSVVGLGLVAGLVYAVVHWPLVTLAAVVPPALLMIGSVLVARRLVARHREPVGAGVGPPGDET